MFKLLLGWVVNKSTDDLTLHVSNNVLLMNAELYRQCVIIHSESSAFGIKRKSYFQIIGVSGEISCASKQKYFIIRFFSIKLRLHASRFQLLMRLREVVLKDVQLKVCLETFSLHCPSHSTWEIEIFD